MRYRRTPCLTKKQMAALEEEIRQNPDRESEIRLEKDPRATYKIFDDNGNIVAEFNPETDTTMDVTIDVKRRITRLMHSKVDDPEVKQNNKERKLPEYLQEQTKAMIEKYREEFHKKYGYYPKADEIPFDVHRRHTPIDAPVGEAGGATIAEVIPDENVTFYKEEETPASVMAELLETDEFCDRERIIYECKARRLMTDAETGKVIGTSGQYAGRLWGQIQKKIRNNPRMKRFYQV